MPLKVDEHLVKVITLSTSTKVDLKIQATKGQKIVLLDKVPLGLGDVDELIEGLKTLKRFAELGSDHES